MKVQTWTKMKQIEQFNIDDYAQKLLSLNTNKLRNWEHPILANSSIKSTIIPLFQNIIESFMCKNGIPTGFLSIDNRRSI